MILAEMRPTTKKIDPIEEAYLYAHPNPGRIGCPSPEVLSGLARKVLPISHPARRHLGDCSPCYQEFKRFEAQDQKAQAERKLSFLLMAAAALLVVCGLSIGKVIQINSKLHAADGELQRMSNTLKEANSAQIPVASLLGPVLTARGVGAPPAAGQGIVIPANASAFVVLLTIDSNSYASYDVDITNGDKRQVAHRDGLKGEDVGKGSFVVPVSLPAKPFGPKGDYFVELRGHKQNGETEFVAHYEFDVVSTDVQPR